MNHLQRSLLCLPCILVGWGIIHERFDLCNQRLDGDNWVCFDNWLDDLFYDVFVKLSMIFSEHWCETSVLTSNTLDNPFVMSFKLHGSKLHVQPFSCNLHTKFSLFWSE